LTQYPPISVVIPAYNRAATIARCLDSVVNQSLPPTEVVVVDDCSSDDTARVIDSYPSALVRRVTLARRSGAQAARNAGVRAAAGSWIAFQDSDDEWMPEKLEKQVDALAPVDFDPWTVVHTGGIALEASGPRELSFAAMQGDDVYYKLLASPGPMFQGLLVSSEALEKIGRLDEDIPSYHEWDTSLALARHCRFIYIDEPLFTYHRLSNDRISDSIEQDISGYVYVLEKYKSEIVAHFGEPTWQHFCRHQLIRALDARLWKCADATLPLLSRRDPRSVVLGLCRRFHLSTKPVHALRSLTRRDGRTGEPATEFR
jgi:glycosyltransferase involved in cell wall biosynthesis